MVIRNEKILKFFIVTTLIAHIWATVLVGIKENILLGIGTFFLPFVAETVLCFLYWKEEPFFVSYVALHLLISGYYSLPGKRLM